MILNTRTKRFKETCHLPLLRRISCHSIFKIKPMKKKLLITESGEVWKKFQQAKIKAWATRHKMIRPQRFLMGWKRLKLSLSVNSPKLKQQQGIVTSPSRHLKKASYPKGRNSSKNPHCTALQCLKIDRVMIDKMATFQIIFWAKLTLWARGTLPFRRRRKTANSLGLPHVSTHRPSCPAQNIAGLSR